MLQCYINYILIELHKTQQSETKEMDRKREERRTKFMKGGKKVEYQEQGTVLRSDFHLQTSKYPKL